LDGAIYRRAITGLEGLTFHDLRRANATALVLDGIDLKTAQTRLGHSDPRLTPAVYAQATSEADRAAADALGRRFLTRAP
jgi:integrase